MSDDIFSIKDIREIILSFPQSKVSRDTSRGDVLLPSTGGGFILRRQVVQQFNDLIATTSTRLSPNGVAGKLGIDVKTVAELLAAEGSRLCYDANKQVIIPHAEVEETVDTLFEMASTSFVPLRPFYRDHDMHEDSLLQKVRERNTDRQPDEQLGTGRWYDGQSSPSESYVYSASFLESSRNDISLSIQQASESGTPKTWSESEMKGLDIKSFACFAENLVAKASGAEGHVAADHDSGLVTFTPNSYIVRVRNDTIESLSKAGYVDLRSLVSVSPDLFSDAEAAASSFTKRYGQDVTIVEGVAIDRTFWAEAAEAQATNLETQGYLKIQSPFPPDFRGGALNPWFKDRVGDSARAQRRETEIDQVGPYLLTRRWLDQATEALTQRIRDAAHAAWTKYAAAPDKIPYPAAPFSSLHASEPNSAFFEQIPKPEVVGGAADVPDDLVRGVFEQHLRKAAAGVYQGEVRKCDADNEREFAAAWRAVVLDRLQLFQQGIEALEAGTRLRGELAALLAAHATAELPHAGPPPGGPRACGRRVRPALDRLRDECAALAAGGDAEADVAAARRAYDGCATRLSLRWLDADGLLARKREELADMAGSALARFDEKGDGDGSRLFLVVILVLLARHQDGLLYATGRFVPRLLKLLKGRIDEGRWKRLQELKDEVKSGAMSEQGRADLREMLSGD